MQQRQHPFKLIFSLGMIPFLSMKIQLSYIRAYACLHLKGKDDLIFFEAGPKFFIFSFIEGGRVKCAQNALTFLLEG